MSGSTSLRADILQTLSSQHGVVFARPAVVHREMYAGRGIIAPNTAFKPAMVDTRGYLPVEWWIMSRTEAKNAVPLTNEGITSLLVGGRPVLLPEALAVAETELMGGSALLWPLTKVLDIGGEERRGRYSKASATVDVLPEVPPIPCHVHAGEVESVSGEGGRWRCVGHGKTEAYFFPPLDVPPYNLRLSDVKTRLGLKPDVTRDQVLNGLRQFGCFDDLYSLLNEYEIKPWETWTIEEKTIHAPGPWLTVEVQLPQDDFHLLAWQLGESMPAAQLAAGVDTYHLRGLTSEEQLLEETLHWERNTDPEFRKKWWHECECLEEGEWGRRVRLFYHIFYGEGFVIRPQKSYVRKEDGRPYAGLVWSGEGRANGQQLHCSESQRREFLVTPEHSLRLENSSYELDLMVFTIFPLLRKP